MHNLGQVIITLQDVLDQTLILTQNLDLKMVLQRIFQLRCQIFASLRRNDFQVSKDNFLLALKPEIPVGGRCLFLENWKKITTDQWVLDTIKDGYKLEFLKIPPFLGIKHTVVSSQKEDLISKEMGDLLKKNAIEFVPEREKQSGFYSTLFLIPKKNGKQRPVINLRPLNQYLAKKHFKMDTLQKVINLAKPGDWAISTDLADAYLHIPIFPKHRRFLRFCFQNRCYQ